MKLPVKEFDAIVVGAGGAGMRAAYLKNKELYPHFLLKKVRNPVY